MNSTVAPLPGFQANARTLSATARRRIAVYALLLVGLLFVLGTTMAASQRDARRALEQRFATRTQLAADFLDAYARDLLEREESLATRRLADASLAPDALAEFAEGFGFEAAVLLDESGRVLQAVPPEGALVGQDLTPRYEHLRLAVRGTRTVSRLVPSAARAQPVVAFATPFRTPGGGRRVVSGAFHVARTPLGAYLAHAIPVGGFEAFLLDDTGTVLAGNAAAPGGEGEGTALAAREPALAAAAARGRQGTYASGGRRRFVVTHPVRDTPWRLVMTVPTARLHAPLGPLSRVPWLVFACFAGAGAIMLDLLRRLHLRAGELERLSTVDPLTGVANRRQVEEAARVIDASARRFDSTTAVLLVDLDHFKAVNDLFGHGIGDEVLRVTAARVAAGLRSQDLVGRLGGEEFVVVLPAVDAERARATAERLRNAIAAPMSVGHHVIGITVSIGCAVGPVVEDLVRDADHALYRAKQAGRDRVVMDRALAALAETIG